MRWTLKTAPNLSLVDELSEVLSIDKVLSSLLIQRGVQTFDQAKKFFRPSLDDLHDPFLLKDMDIAVSRIEKAIANNENILIYGDYDVDGTTAVSLVSSYLKTITNHIATYIPDRYGEGYGISTQGIDFAADHDFSLIIALDCGIKAIDKVKYASQKNIDFIICDHHKPGDKLPKAVAVLNPKRKDCSYPFDELCGCGVGFKLIQAINFKKGLDIENIVNYLDLVSLAIAADIVPIVGENRILAHIGMQVINSNPRVGIHSILKNNIKKEFNIGDLLFYVAPRINAAGRIAHASLSLDLLLESDIEKADKLSKKIDELNTQRREIEKSITKQALDQIEESDNQNRNATVVYHKSWNRGVIGIVASRLIEKHYKPTIVFCKSDDGYLTASARSIKNVDLYEILEQCKTNIVQFGGHKYAAGLTIKEENYDLFKQSFEKAVSKYIKNNLPEQEIIIESQIKLASITSKFFRILNQFEPFGPGNRTPVFLSKGLSLNGKLNMIGKNKEHIKFSVNQESKNSFSAIGFWLSEKCNKIKADEDFSMAYTIDQNTWNGNTTIQLKIKDIK